MVLASACACAISPTASLAHARHGECCAGAPLFAQGAEPGARVGSLEGRPAPARARPGDSVALRGAASRPVHRCRNRRRGSGPPLHGRAQPCTANPEPGRRTGGRGAGDAAPPASGATPGAASAAAALSPAEASGGPHSVFASAPEARWGSRGSAVANAGAPAPAAALASRRRGGQGMPE